RPGDDLLTESLSFSFKKAKPSGQQPYFPGLLRVSGNFGDTVDQLTIDSQGFEDTADQLTMGGGDDQVHVRHRMFSIVDRTNTAYLDTALGDGVDEYSLDLDGYHQVATRVDGGAGDDLVAINQQADHPDLFKNVWINQTDL